MAGGILRNYYTPLRYPGGKGKVANYIKLLFLQNNLLGSVYVEPFAGGASVALNLLFEEYASHVVINDLNRGVHSFWDAVLNQTDALSRLIHDTPVTMDEWYRQRQVFRDTSAEGLSLGFATFFLNRTNRSGIIWGGVIGGKEQEGRWKLDARFNKNELIGRIKKIARNAARITLLNLDAAALLKRRVPGMKGRVFVYLDPPYYIKGEGLYENFYDRSDHEAIRKLVAQLECPWIVSYDAHEAILKLYKDYSSVRYGLSYSAQERYRGSEVMFFSPGLVFPDTIFPANVPTKVLTKTEKRPMFQVAY